MRGAAIAVLGLVLAAGCTNLIGGGDDIEATVRWTSYGIPHIQADDWRGLGYGYGYAAATDYLCVIAEDHVTVRAERSQFFGPDGEVRYLSSGAPSTNLESDLFFALLKTYPEIVHSSTAFPNGDLQDLLDGYVAGYNRYLRDTPESERPADCRGEAWVREIDRNDVDGRVNKLALIASMGALLQEVVGAEPPAPGTQASPPLSNGELAALAERLPVSDALGIGSNGYAFGREMTANGRGLLLGNPHFPWHGAERFHQLHLTIPGEVDVMGTTLLGVPLVLIGFSEAVAWTHTVSTGWRFSLHELQLAPGDPTSYIVDGSTEPMEPYPVTVNTTDRVVEHTFWRSRYGFVLELPLAGTPPVEAGLLWSADRAYAIHDANAANDRIAEQFYQFNTARTFDEFLASLDDVHGIPWVNTIAASPDGRAFYGDISVVPNYDEERITACNTLVGRGLFEVARLPVFDGSRSACAPGEHADARQPGILPASAMPRITTTDWLINSNDDYWLPNPEHPLEGYSPMIGWGPSERSTRTRMGYVLAQEVASGTSPLCHVEPEIACDKFTLERLQHALFSNRLYVPEHELKDLLATVCAVPLAISSSGQPVDLSEACTVLATWDRTAKVDSAGLPLFERFWLTTPKAWTTPFDASDPVHTPRGFVAADPRVRLALADTVLAFQGVGLPLGATAGEARYVERDGERIGLHGADGRLGSPSMLVVPWQGDSGFAEPVHGNSYIQTVTWDADGRPVAEAVLSYSQSPHSDSPHRADQTRLYGRSQWVGLPFSEAAIEADPDLRTIVLRRG